MAAAGSRPTPGSCTPSPTCCGGRGSRPSLRRLPVDTLKVDRRFIARMDQTDVAVLAAILEMARALGLQTVAEGIETREQLDQLQALGCDLGQGYFLARPMDAAQVPGYLEPGAERAA
jgi:EAL domain-containing protein (putative c-di-GMP-specific phosphodiesterase class I)